MSLPRDAIIVVGMHRSGTSLVSRLLGQLGVFMGADLNMHAESGAFLDINARIFRLAHGDWDVPEPVVEVLNNEQVAADLSATIASDEWPNLERQYLGRDSLTGRLRASTRPPVWGWKDPRNSITLPVWQNLMPDARIVHVFRNPADVALSLAAREQARYRIRLDRPTLRSPRCLDKVVGASLWTAYVAACVEARESSPARSWLDLCYEDLLATPIAGLRQLAKFVASSASDDELEDLAGTVNAGRAYAFREGAESDWGNRLIMANPQAQLLGYTERLDNLAPAAAAGGIQP